MTLKKILNKPRLPLPVYPLLLGAYPVLFLWAKNYIQLSGFAEGRTLIIMLGFALIVSLIWMAIFRNLLKAAAAAGLSLFLFITYGHLFTVIDNWKILGVIVGRHRYLVPLWVAILAAGVYWIVRTKSDLRNLTRLLNLVTITLVGFSFVQIGYQALARAQRMAKASAAAQVAPTPSANQAPKADTPDVYYFLLDGYSREDSLKAGIQLDNHAFISELEKLGFVVPSCTQSNYDGTIFSMTATLNMNYIDALGFSYARLAKMGQDGYTSALEPQILYNQVIQNFRGMGYKIITLASEYPFLNFPDTDIVYNYGQGKDRSSRQAADFQYLFFRTTLMRPVLEELERDPTRFAFLPRPILQLIDPTISLDIYKGKSTYYYGTYMQNLYQLSQLESVAKVPGKKFLYAHLLVTHPPYSMTATGEPTTVFIPTSEGYAGAVQYANRRMLTIIKNILAESKTPPIIILQGDHGSGALGQRDDKFKILNAYYLPHNGSKLVYPQITPVNTFRLIFSNYFQENYPLLPDQSIFVSAKLPGSFEIIPPTCVH